MKKLLLPAVLSVATLSGCATTDVQTVTSSASNIGMSIFKTAVDNKCRSELNANSIYKTASLLLTSEQKTALEDKTCGCVSEKAPESVTMTELGQAVIDPTARPQIVGTAVTKTLSACVSEFVSKI